MSGGGGGQSFTQYFMSLHYGICAGPIDAFMQIQYNNKQIWSGLGTSNQTILIDNQDLFGGTSSSGGVYGRVDFYLGTETQKATQNFADRLTLTPDTMPGYRDFASAFFYGGPKLPGPDPYKGFYWSANLAVLQNVDIKVLRYPFGPSGDRIFREDRTANPAHIIYECLTNSDWGMGSPLSLLDVESFRACATILEAENFGLSILWSRSDTIESFISIILNHVQAVINVNPTTGKIRIKLLRGDYLDTEVPIIHPGNATLTKWQRVAWGESGNEVVVTWTNPDNEEEETVTVQDPGAVAVQGAVISTSRSYPGIRSAELATTVAYRDLRQSCAPLLSIEFDMNRQAWDWQTGDVFEVRWPEYGIGSMYVRCLAINYGKPGASTIHISVIEDIFAFGNTIYTDIPVDDPSSPPPRPDAPEVPAYTPPPFVPDPSAPNTQAPDVQTDENPRVLDHLYMGGATYFSVVKAIGDGQMSELPYPAAVTWLMASQDGIATSGVGLWIEKTDSFGTLYFANTKILQNMGRGKLAAALVAQNSSTVAALSNMSGQSASPGYFLLLVDDVNPDLQEICGIVSIDADNNMVVQRGLLDTIPRAWGIGTIAWLFPMGAAIFDTTTRPAGSTANYKFTPKTANGMLPLDSATTQTVTVEERLHLPYRPARVAIYGDLYGTPNPPQGPVLCEWANRNRVTETGSILSWEDATVTPEDTQTTTLRIKNGSGTIVASYSGLTGTSYTIPESAFLAVGGTSAVVELYSERTESTTGDVLQSFMTVTRNVSLAGWTFPGYGKLYGRYYGGV